MKISLIGIFSVFFLQFCFAQNTVQIHGLVIDASSKEPLSFANISIENSEIGTATDSDGIYKLKLKNHSTYTIICSHLGYKEQNKTISISNDETVQLNFELSPNSQTLNEVLVVNSLTSPVKRAGESLYTGTAITKNGLSLIGMSAKTSVYSSLQFVPQIMVSSADAYGLSEKEIRNRGVRSLFGGLTVEGVPNYGIMPIGARDYIYDMENMEQVSVFSGAVPSDLGLATGSRGCVIELTYKRPQDEQSINISQAFGSNQFSRSFIRFDSGEISKNLKAFGSYSYTTANKWKGEGKLATRHTIGLGLTHKASSFFQWELFANFNDLDRHQFRPLSYDLASNLNKNFDLDFDSELSSVPSEALNYYDYNKGNYINKDVLLIANFFKNDAIRLSFKTYYSDEKANYKNTIFFSGRNLQQDRQRDISRYGFIPSIQGKINKTSYSVAYWGEVFDNNVYIWNNALTPNGLQPRGYSFYTVPNGKGYIYSPFAKVSLTLGKLSLQSGLKYFYFQESSALRYRSLPDDPFTLSDTPEADLKTDKITNQVWLPSLGIGYAFNDSLKLYLNYGRNYMRPYMYVPTISLYLQNRETFLLQGLTLQSIYDNWKMETSHNFDLGLQLDSKTIKFYPTVYFSKHQNVLTSLYDEDTQTNYYRNAGSVNSYGLNIETYYAPFKNWLLYINPAYTKIYYPDNILRTTGSGTTEIELADNQLPATPIVSGKAGIRFTNEFMDISLNGEFIGKRYGDATNIEEIPSYFLLNSNLRFFNYSYSFFKHLEGSLELKNILNEKYISVINVNDDSSNGEASYLTGFPRTLIVSINIIF